MDQSKRFKQLEELMAEMLRKQDQHTERFDQLITSFNTGFNAMLKKMDEFTTEVKGLREDFQKFANHEERIRKLEDTVFRRGA